MSDIFPIKGHSHETFGGNVPICQANFIDEHSHKCENAKTLADIG